MYRKNINLLSAFNFLIGFNLMAPLAIIYFSKVAGSFTLGTSIFGVIMLSAAIFEVPTGVWSDRVGRKQTIIFGSWARFLGFGCYAIGLSYWWLVAGAILEGLSRALYSGNNDALLYDSLVDDGQENEYREQLGKTSSTEQTALAIAALLGSVIASWSFSYVMWLSVMTQLGLVMVSYRFIETRSHKLINTNLYAHLREAIGLFAKNKKLRLLSVASMLNFAISDLAYQFRGAFYNTIWPIWAIGFANVISNLSASISFYFSGKLLSKVKAETLVLFRSSYDRIINLISLIFPSVFSPILMSSTSLLYGVGQVAENHLRQQEFSDHQRATMSSLNSLGGSVGLAIMTLVLGGIADLYGPRNALILMTILALAPTYLYLRVYKK